jgi:hypothetical protein
VEYYLAIKRNETLSFATQWIELEDIMLSEITDSVLIGMSKLLTWKKTTTKEVIEMIKIDPI